MGLRYKVLRAGLGAIALQSLTASSAIPERRSQEVLKVLLRGDPRDLEHLCPMSEHLHSLQSK